MLQTSYFDLGMVAARRGVQFLFPQLTPTRIRVGPRGLSQVPLALFQAIILPCAKCNTSAVTLRGSDHEKQPGPAHVASGILSHLLGARENSVVVKGELQTKERRGLIFKCHCNAMGCFVRSCFLKMK